MQASPAQQSSPGPPHCSHTFCPLQATPAEVQVRFAQQGWPGPPQAAHCVPLQVWPDAVHCMPVQHACPPAPQPPHEPAAQAPPMFGQVEPDGVQRLATQQPPSAQSLPAQQASPAPPHCVQMPAPLPVHTSVVSQARPGQHFCPAAPHGWQTPPTQAPAVQLSPAQQTLPSVPQAPPSEPPALMSAPDCPLFLVHPEPANQSIPRRNEASTLRIS